MLAIYSLSKTRVFHFHYQLLTANHQPFTLSAILL